MKDVVKSYMNSGSTKVPDDQPQRYLGMMKSPALQTDGPNFLPVGGHGREAAQW